MLMITLLILVGDEYESVFNWPQVPSLVRCISMNYKEDMLRYLRLLLFYFLWKTCKGRYVKEVMVAYSYSPKKERIQSIGSYSVPAFSYLFISFSPQDNSMRRALLSLLFYKWGNWLRDSKARLPAQLPEVWSQPAFYHTMPLVRGFQLSHNCLPPRGSLARLLGTMIVSPLLPSISELSDLLNYLSRKGEKKTLTKLGKCSFIIKGFLYT